MEPIYVEVHQDERQVDIEPLTDIEKITAKFAMNASLSNSLYER
jgi:hypothetical protein